VTHRLAEALPATRDAGRKVFVPYVTGGLAGVDASLLRGLRDSGADAIEVGLPFSDPVMDGPVIQEASRLALEDGATPRRVLDLVATADLDIPVAVMTYLNPVLAFGLQAFATEAMAAGVSGAILPDLPVDEAGEWLATCSVAELAPVLLAAPNSAPDRLTAVAAASKGFVYCVSTLGVTGAREDLSSAAEPVVESLRRLTGTPLLVGVGISTPEQAARACRFADGVVVGTAMVEPVLRGDRDAALRRAEAFRTAVDAAARR